MTDGASPISSISASELKLWHLKSCPLFARLSPDELGAIFDASRLVTLDPGECVPNSPMDEPVIWVVKRGYIKLAYVDDEGRDAAIMILSPGDIFGSLLEDNNKVFGEMCHAMTGVCLARLGQKQFDRLIRRFPDLAFEINKANFERIYRLQVRVGELLIRSVEERLALTLLELDKVVGKDDGAGGRELNIPISHRDLAQLVGSSREMVTHVMGRLRKRGLVKTGQRRQVVLLDLEGLKKASQPKSQGV